ncbi:mitochondrial import inner membrane translocase subunit TIM44 isoform X2 [Nematostella vectensis]|uniref:mitochondrial import inner membrane translocase subunit TIM44 isoform X2 n=1 Tax=Nematostella vectensis TaxID=45351 RepID=UPI002077601F|nr:mitochondrial import inner membrane translocase subunit TIM44 isoform X2 [Nematostella vectensis]
MAQVSLSRYFCANCRSLSRVEATRVYGGVCQANASSPWTALTNSHRQQARLFAFRRQNEQPGLFGKFIQNIKEGIERNKEMQENIKKFQKEAKKFESSETLKTAKSRFEFVEKVKENLSEVSAKFSSTARSISGTMSTKVSQMYEDLTASDTFKKSKEASEELTKSAKDAASKVQEQTEEITKTGTFKTVSKGFKVVKEELVDEELKQSRPYQTPAELRRRTAVNMNQTEIKEKRIEANEDATGVVLHKDSKWYQQWKEFKDNNPVVTSLFNLKMKYDESDNVVIRATRVVTDRLTDVFSDVFSQSEMAKTLSEITKIDPQFNKDRFLQECEFEIIPAVLEGFLQGKLDILKDWCHEPAYNVLAAQIVFVFPYAYNVLAAQIVFVCP